MDPRQRSSDRRRFKAIAGFIGVGVGLVGLGLVLKAMGYEGSGRREMPPELLVVLGVGVVVAGLADLVRRLIKGPQPPGKRARF